MSLKLGFILSFIYIILISLVRLFGDPYDIVWAIVGAFLSPSIWLQEGFENIYRNTFGMGFRLTLTNHYAISTVVWFLIGMILGLAIDKFRAKKIK